MISEVVNVSINGDVQDDIVPDVLEIELQEDIDSADVFRVRLGIHQQFGGAWSYVDDRRFRIWNRLSIQAGYPDDHATIVDGYITHVDAAFGTHEHESYLEISGMDPSCLMDLDDKQLAWANKKDHEIARAIFTSYGLHYEVEDTVAQHQEAVSTILQTESDVQFLRRLAARNGFECFVRGRTGYFRSPNMQDRPQKILAVQFGDASNLSSLHVRVDGTPPSVAEIRRLDPMEKMQQTQALSGTPRRALGARSLADLRAGVADGRVFLKRQASASPQEMRGRLRDGCEGASRFVTVEGDIDGRAYLAVLRPQRLVTVKGAGESFSGLYYVTAVRHKFTIDEYTQHFTAYRNGIGLTGDEDFGAASLLPIALPAVSLPGGTAGAGDRVLPPESQSGSVGGL
jgi:phage protein D